MRAFPTALAAFDRHSYGCAVTSVLLLEDDDDLRATLELAFLSVGGAQSVFACSSAQEVFELGRRVVNCTCAILDVNLGFGVPSGIDVAVWLSEQGFRGRIIFLTGHAGAFPQLSEIARRIGAVVLEKPTPLPRLLSLAQEPRA